jgi:hypothetical protein
MPTVGQTHFESDGKAVDVTLSHAVVAKQVAYVQQFLGLTNVAGSSGDTIALNIDKREYQLVVPAAFNPAVGDIIYIDSADLTGHTPDDSAYYTATGAGRVAFAKVTRVKNASNVLTAIML